MLIHLNISREYQGVSPHYDTKRKSPRQIIHPDLSTQIWIVRTTQVESNTTILK